jgi:hypothetical protein
MIEKLDEKAYRKLSRDSYSSIKDFLEDRKKYYKKYVLKEKVVDEVSSAMIFGNLVDCLLLEPHTFDEKFYVAQCQCPPPQMKRLAEALFERSVADAEEDGTLKTDLDVLLTYAYNDVKYDREGNDVAFRRKGQTIDTVKKEFYGGPALDWYK